MFSLWIQSFLRVCLIEQHLSICLHQCFLIKHEKKMNHCFPLCHIYNSVVVKIINPLKQSELKCLYKFKLTLNVCNKSFLHRDFIKIDTDLYYKIRVKFFLFCFLLDVVCYQILIPMLSPM